MICGKLNDFEAMGLTVLGDAVLRAVAWIRSMPANASEGRHVLWDDRVRALVLRYATGEASHSRFETHRRYVDFQYTLAGAEVIEWAPRGTLANDGDYDAANDLLFHLPGPAMTRITKSAGMFSIYTPVDAHRGKIRAGGIESVLKLVIKIPVEWFPTS
jgi:biofilm protein TabA